MFLFWLLKQGVRLKWASTANFIVLVMCSTQLLASKIHNNTILINLPKRICNLPNFYLPNRENFHHLILLQSWHKISLVIGCGRPYLTSTWHVHTIMGAYGVGITCDIDLYALVQHDGIDIRLQFEPIHNRSSWGLSFHVLGLELRCKSYEKSKWRFSFSISDHVLNPFNSVSLLNIERY